MLQEYVGEYQLGMGTKVNIKTDNGQLIAEVPNKSEVNLFAETKSKFYAKGVFTKVNFVRNDSGKVTGFNLEQYGGVTFANKISDETK